MAVTDITGLYGPQWLHASPLLNVRHPLHRSIYRCTNCYSLGRTVLKLILVALLQEYLLLEFEEKVNKSVQALVGALSPCFHSPLLFAQELLLSCAAALSIAVLLSPLLWPWFTDLTFWLDLRPASSLWTCWMMTGCLDDLVYHPLLRHCLAVPQSLLPPVMEQHLPLLLLD